MIKPYYLLALYLISTTTVWGAAFGDAQVRVLVVGDSWAEFMWDDRALRDVFSDNGHPEILEKGDVTAISGSWAADWATPNNLALITSELNANPFLEVVQLTAGGNDFLAGQSGGGWHTGMSEQDKAALFQQIADNIQIIIDHVKGLNPEIKILLSFYDYPNFQESLTGIMSFFCQPMWQDMGSPPVWLLNEVMIELLDLAASIAAGDPQVYTVRHQGLMQFHFGYPSLGIQPGTLPQPGDALLPSPPEAMRFFNQDCIHVSAEGHRVVVQNLWDHFYKEAFCTTETQYLEALTSWPTTDIRDLIQIQDTRCETEMQL